MSTPTPRELRAQRARARQLAEAERMRQHRMEFVYASEYRCSLEEANIALRRRAALAAELAIAQRMDARMSRNTSELVASVAPRPEPKRMWWLD